MKFNNKIKEIVLQTWEKFCQKCCAHKQRISSNNQQQLILSIDIQHNIVNAINESLGEQIRPFGQIVRDAVLTPFGYVIYVDTAHSRIVLLKSTCPELCKCEEGLMVRVIFDILALLKSLEENLLVYRLFSDEKYDSVLYDAGQECTPSGDSFKLNATQTLLMENGHWCIKENNSNIYQESFSFEEEIYNQLKNLLESLIYPTEGLESYILYNYQSQEDYINFKSLERAKKANWIAILVGVSSLVIGPSISLLLNNKCGQTRLADASIDSLVNAKQTIQIVRDTIIIPKQDTVKCIIIQDKTKHTKGGKE